MARTIFIGDVHGCIDELQDLLRACQQAADDRVVLVGDLVAKGPASLEVVQFARESRFESVLGNHDDHVLAMRGKDAESAKREDHARIAADMPAADMAWFSARPLHLAFDFDGQTVLAVHAGLVPGVPLELQTRKHLLNLRSIKSDGTPSRKIEGQAWASLWPGPAHVVFGHDAVRGLQRHPHATGLDTGCVYGHRLTAMTWPQRQLVSVPSRRCYSPLRAE